MSEDGKNAPNRTSYERPCWAYIFSSDSMQCAALLGAATSHWLADGVHIVGVLAESDHLPEGRCTAGSLREISSNRIHTIRLGTLPEGVSCHLDAAGVDAACTSVLPEIPKCDLVVLSKFGKLEAAGSGLAQAFRLAAAERKPVLTTVSAKHAGVWRAFAPDAMALTADESCLRRWWSDYQMRTAMVLNS